MTTIYHQSFQMKRKWHHSEKLRRIKPIMFRSSVNKWWWKNWCYIHHTPIARKLPGKKKYSWMEITLLTVMYGDVKSKFRVILNTAMCFQLMVIFARVWSVCFFFMVLKVLPCDFEFTMFQSWFLSFFAFFWKQCLYDFQSGCPYELLYADR